MTDDRVEIVRAVYDEWSRGNFGAGIELYDPQVLMIQSPGFPDTRPYVGLDAVRSYTRGWLEAFGRVTIAAEALEAEGDTVIVSVVQEAEGKGSGAPAAFRYFQLWTFRGDRVIRLEAVRDRAAVETAIGRAG